MKVWKKVCMLLICTLALCGTAQMNGYARENATLRVTFYPLAGFFEYDGNGQETGYGVEVLNLISKYSGLQFSYVKADSWESTKSMLLDGEADVRMPGTAPKIPSETLGYTQHSVIDSFYAIMTLKSRQDLYYRDYDSFSQLKIGISQNLYNTSDFEQYLEKAGIADNQLVFFDGYNDCRAALADGSIDAVISNIMDLDDEMKQLERFSTVSNYVSMTIGNPYLDIINDAIAAIQMNEPETLSNLYKEWFPERVMTPLTREETEYLESVSSLCFSFRDGQGYMSRKEKDGSFSGFYPEVAQLLCDRLGVKCTQTDAVDEAMGGVGIYPDFYYDCVWAQDCDTDITEPYFTVNYYELTLKNHSLDKDTCLVAAVKNYRVTKDYISNGYREEQMVWCRDYEECMEAVYSGKADVTYVNSYTAEYYLSLYRYSGIASTLTDYSHQACLGVYGDDTGLLTSILDKTMQTIKSDELNALMIKANSEKPQQNLVLEWVYQKPVRSVMLVSAAVSIVAFIVLLLFYVRRIRLNSIQVAKAMNIKQEFLSRMSHDMRTPMNAIIGFSEFGKECKELTEAVDYHTKINKAAKYLLQLINDSLDLSKLENRNYELHKEPYTNSEFVESISNILKPKAIEKGIDFQISCDQGPSFTLLFDKIRLQQIFVNLLNNAIKFTPAGGHVKLAITHRSIAGEKCTVCFQVSDDGIGMSEEFVRDKLYKPFEQEQSCGDEQGTGLGLSIAKELVESMGGTISCESTPGKGTTFNVILPGQRAAITKAVPVQSERLKLKLEGRHVLLCEDHPMNREITDRLLEKEGIMVSNAENGQVGLQLFVQSEPGFYDLILMDIRMPVMDGLEATRRIRALHRADAASIPIIALSANALDEDVESCEKAGMTQHLAKPIVPGEFYQMIAKYVQEK